MNAPGMKSNADRGAVMKKIFVYLLILPLLAGALFLTSCGEKKEKRLIMVTEATFPPYEFRSGRQQSQSQNSYPLF